jgi:purine-nucleoside phosphorylase
VPNDQRPEFELASRAARRLADAGFGDAVALVQTGSGLAAPDLADVVTLPWSEIDGFPRATAPGHRGALHHGTWHGVPVLVLEGRLHLYEGHEPAHVVRPLRAIGLLGVRIAILTNAAGGVRPGLVAGSVVRVSDHLNLMRVDPLSGAYDARFGERFVVTAGRCHDAALGVSAHEVARTRSIELTDGVYAALPGPSFETPAEVAMLRTLGADVVGMSTVPEVLAATQLGMRTLVLSLVANPAGQVTTDATAEDEVLEVGRTHGARLMEVVAGVVERLGRESLA